MSSEGAVQSPKDTISPTASSPQRSSCHSDHKLLPQAETSRFSRLNPRTWSRKARLITFAALLLAIVALIPAIAVPLALAGHSSHKGIEQLPASGRTTRLRIMPLGASITFGMLSSDGNGYRNDLLELLSRGGNPNVTYVGSRNSGNMTQNAVEGWPGDKLDQLYPRARDAVTMYLPNVILVNAGTNDCVLDFNIDSTTQPSPVTPDMTSDASYNVGTRMRALVDGLLGWSPNTTVVVSTLITNVEDVVQTRIDDANAQFRAVVEQLQSEGKSVVLAEMTTEAGGPDNSMMVDYTHPNDTGYALMANRWYAALVEASQKGLLVQPL